MLNAQIVRMFDNVGQYVFERSLGLSDQFRKWAGQCSCVDSARSVG
jgi:hypothetical protein